MAAFLLLWHLGHNYDYFSFIFGFKCKLHCSREEIQNPSGQFLL